MPRRHLAGRHARPLGAQRLDAPGGRIDAGVEAPARLRLEGFPPVVYGSRPYFILVANGDDATLVLPRDDRVLLGARPGEIVEALAGVPLGPADLRAVLAGCGLAPASRPARRGSSTAAGPRSIRGTRRSSSGSSTAAGASRRSRAGR
jgi:hypothetical protein